jgi:F-type H+-transporting ATPase subunit alpha
VADQVASIWSGTKGKLDDVPVQDVKRFESELLDHLRRKTDVLGTIAETGKLEAETEAALAAAVDEFREGFMTFDGHSLTHGDDGAEVEIEQEQIVRQKKG